MGPWPQRVRGLCSELGTGAVCPCRLTAPCGPEPRSAILRGTHAGCWAPPVPRTLRAERAAERRSWQSQSGSAAAPSERVRVAVRSGVAPLRLLPARLPRGVAQRWPAGSRLQLWSAVRPALCGCPACCARSSQRKPGTERTFLETTGLSLGSSGLAWVQCVRRPRRREGHASERGESCEGDTRSRGEAGRASTPCGQLTCCIRRTNTPRRWRIGMWSPTQKCPCVGVAG